MAKIGTAHIEVKPVLDEAALERIAVRIEEAVAAGVRRGMATGTQVHVAQIEGVTDVAAEVAKAARRYGSRNV